MACVGGGVPDNADADGVKALGAGCMKPVGVPLMKLKLRGGWPDRGEEKLGNGKGGDTPEIVDAKLVPPKKHKTFLLAMLASKHNEN